jgi:hypothetical protein
LVIDDKCPAILQTTRCMQNRQHPIALDRLKHHL